MVMMVVVSGAMIVMILKRRRILAMVVVVHPTTSHVSSAKANVITVMYLLTICVGAALSSNLRRNSVLVMGDYHL